MNVRETIRDNLVRERKRRKLSPAEFSKLLRVSRSRISDWESGGPGPDLGRLPELAKLLGTTVDALLKPGARRR